MLTDYALPVNCHSTDEATKLYYRLLHAILSNDKEYLLQKLEGGANPNFYPPNSKTTLLVEAVKRNNYRAVRLLQRYGARDIQTRNGLGTALHYAASSGYLYCVHLLSGKSESLFLKDFYGRTPLTNAARNGHLAVVRLLLNRMSSLREKLAEINIAISVAAYRGHANIVNFLLPAIDHTHYGSPAAKVALKKAILEERVDVAERIVKNICKSTSSNGEGAFPLLSTEQGLRPMLLLATSLRNEKMVRALLSCALGQEFVADEVDRLYMYAVNLNDSDFVNCLLEKGVQIISLTNSHSGGEEE